MAPRPRALAAGLTVLSALVAAAPAAAAGSAGVAALQVGLRAKGVYAGTVDGVAGRETTEAVRKLQQRAGLVVDGIAGPATRAALGRHGKHALGSRPIVVGAVGWDVSQLQFLLAWQGFPSGPLDGVFGPRTDGALRRFQRWSRLTPDGLVGPATLRALRASVPTSPVALAWPVDVPVTDRFGPRGDRFHTGVDFPAPMGTPVAAAGNGRVAYAGWLVGGWGFTVTIAHGSGVRTMYAHLSSVDVRVGDAVVAGARIGAVGASGRSTGPHLHFEVRLRGAAVDPLPAFG
jgi:murein DD-endopeptidase MepM/ murein hydrolase activator NlpD